MSNSDDLEKMVEAGCKAWQDAYGPPAQFGASMGYAREIVDWEELKRLAPDTVERLRRQMRAALQALCSFLGTPSLEDYRTMAERNAALRSKIAGLESALRRLLELHDDALQPDATGVGLIDCIDNRGKYYPSQALAEALDQAFAQLAESAALSPAQEEGKEP